MSVIRDIYQDKINPVSINIETLEFLQRHLDGNEVNSVLEFGSGVSTEFWSTQLPDAHIISFDNSRRYRKISASRVNKNATNTHVRFGPLRIMKLFGIHYISYKIGSYLKNNGPEKFDLVLIDGPPGFLYAREATLLQAIDHIRKDTLIILDDAERNVEKETVARWSEMFEMRDLEYHDVGLKQIATFRVSPKPLLKVMPASPNHTLKN